MTSLKERISCCLLKSCNNKFLNYCRKELKRCLEYSNKFQKTNNVVKNSIQIKVTQEFNNEDSLNIDSPHKTELLNYGLNRYDLLYLLGKGSFGTVIKGNYHGENLNDQWGQNCLIFSGNTIAVKIIKLNPSSNYVNEANARHFVHENIIRILDIITSQKYALVMMEYEEKSRNLQCVIDDVDLCLNKKIITKCVKDIARGLRYCHENDVLHLDIKPKNILMVNNNVCKICDFGNSMKTSNIKEIYQFQVRKFFQNSFQNIEICRELLHILLLKF